MQPAKYKRKSFVFARGRYSLGGYETKVYQITKNGVAEWSWEACNNALPPDTLPLREVRRRCLAKVKLLSEGYEAHNAGVKRRPQLTTIKRQLTKLQFAFVCPDFHLLEQALDAFGSDQAAANWLTQPAAEFQGAIPARLAKTHVGWWRVFNSLVRRECEKYFPTK